jgi:hypothetical protein
MKTVQHLLNELSSFDPSSEVVFTCFMEQGRGSVSSNAENTELDIDTIEDQESLDEVYYTNPDIDDDPDPTPTFTKLMVHINMSGEESDYQ